MEEIKIGSEIPDISLKNQNNEEVSLHSYIGKPVVIYFYPKDDTPGCTLEACSFRDQYEDFKDLGADVIGISKDTVQSHKKFAEKHRLSFTLLSDPAGKAICKFGVPRKFFGLTPGRVTYVFDTEGKLIKKFNSALLMKKHVNESLSAIKRMK